MLFCDNDASKWGKKYQQIPIISPEQLLKKENIVVQVALQRKFETEILLQLEKYPISKVISLRECKSQLINYLKLTALKKNPELSEEIANGTRLGSPYWIEFQKNLILTLCSQKQDLPILICMPGKTSDSTIQKTLELHNVLTRQTHFSHWLKRSYLGEKKIKIITALRDPISRDLSHIYQFIESYDGFKTFFYVGNQFDEEAVKVYSSNDAQIYFDRFISCPKPGHSYLWFSEFSNNVVNLLDHPFDTEKGFTIIREDNYDIFCFQLEKLNHVVTELSDWVGVPFDKLENSNIASEKWISNSYDKAKKEIKIPQEYFESCYADPYIQHCYSPKDIEKFKEKWRNNID